MKINNLIIGVVLVLSGCSSIGNEFCSSNGYNPGTSGYSNCQMRYMKDITFYHACADKGITKEGTQLNRCVEEEKSRMVTSEVGAKDCYLESQKKYQFGMLKKKGDEGFGAFTKKGIIGYNNEGDEYYSEDEIKRFREDYLDQCNRERGVKSPLGSLPFVKDLQNSPFGSMIDIH
jgi:hypothetical protein